MADIMYEHNINALTIFKAYVKAFSLYETITIQFILVLDGIKL